MIIRGHIKNGVAVLDEPITLPEGTSVRIEVEPSQTSSFWNNKTLSQLETEHPIRPLAKLEDLAGNWPAEDSIDDFLAWIRKTRA